MNSKHRTPNKRDSFSLSLFNILQLKARAGVFSSFLLLFLLNTKHQERMGKEGERLGMLQLVFPRNTLSCVPLCLCGAAGFVFTLLADHKRTHVRKCERRVCEFYCCLGFDYGEHPTSHSVVQGGRSVNLIVNFSTVSCGFLTIRLMAERCGDVGSLEL